MAESLRGLVRKLRRATDFFIFATAVLFLWIGETWAAEPRRWTYFFFIHGDQDYIGPVYNKGRTTLRDNSRATFVAIDRLARSDSSNDYVIFYDSDSSVHSSVYRKSKRIKTSLDGASELDSTRPWVLGSLFQQARKYLGPALDDSYKLFYFYGEHVPLLRSLNYDRSAPQSPFTLKEFFLGLSESKALGKFDLFVMHSCYMNTLSFLSRVRDLAFQVILPRQTVPNAPMPLAGLLSNAEFPAQLASRLISAAKDSAYPFDLISYDESILGEATSLVQRAEASLGTEGRNEFNSYLKGLSNQVASNTASPLESSVSDPWLLPDTHEIMVPVSGYLGMLNQYAADEELLEEAARWFKRHPEASSIYEVLQPLAPIEEIP